MEGLYYSMSNNTETGKILIDEEQLFQVMYLANDFILIQCTGITCKPDLLTLYLTVVMVSVAGALS